MRSHPHGRVPIGDGPAPVPGVAARRAAGTDRRRRGAARRASPAVVVRCLAAAVMALGATGVSARSAAAAASGAARGGPALVETSQTSWVTPGQVFDVRLAAGRSAPARAALGLTVALYPALHTRSGFDATLASSRPSGTPEYRTRTAIAWSSLPPADGGVDLRVGLSVGGHPAPADTPVTASLQCTTAGGCVYPIRIDLVDRQTRSVVGGLTTFLVYITAPPDGPRLQFGWELPIASAVGAARPSPSNAVLASDPYAALARPTASRLAALDQVATELGTSSVPVTVAASPETLQALSTGGHRTPARLAALSTSASHQFPPQPYAPVDATALVDAGLGNELAAQVQRGAKVLAADQILTTGAHGGAGLGSSGGTWTASGGLDRPTLSWLAANGFNRLVLPSGDVSGPSQKGSTIQPLALRATGGTTVTALTSDAGLGARFSADPGDPVLAAHQLLAELAQIYLEAPNQQSPPRAVVAVPPPDWRVDATFVQTLLGGLASSPVVTSSTIASVFDLLGSASTPAPASLRPVADPGQSLPVGNIRTQRARIDSFASAVPGDPVVATKVGDVLLASESAALRPNEQRAVVQRAGDALGAQLGLFAVATGQSLTLTSRHGSIPVNVDSSAGYPLKGTLVLHSEKLLFSNGKTQWTQPIVLDKSTNVVYVNVRARASGEFRVSVAVDAPSGGLPITGGTLVIRSTVTSVVGVALSLGAILVLLAWWVRTARRRRARRRAAEAAAGDGGPGS